MKQIFLELWIENKQMPILLILKIILIFLSVFSGVLFWGYPYSILALIMVMSLQSVTVKFAAQVEYLIPLSDQDRKRAQIQKSILIAGIYAITNATGYSLTISLCKQYQWDGEMIVFIIMIILFPYILIFNFRILAVRIRYFEFNHALNNRKLKKMAGTIGFDVLTQILALLCIFLFLFYKFARLKEVLFLGTGYWQMLSLVMIGTVFVMLCISAWKNCRKIVILDFCE